MMATTVSVPQTVTVLPRVMEAIQEFIGAHPAERGGMLGSAEDGVITHFEPDKTARCSSAAYDPDIAYLNGVIKDWKNEGIKFVGFVHSHPPRFTQLSDYDKWYAGELLAAFRKLDVLWLPIVQTVPDTGRFELFGHAALPGAFDRKQCQFVSAKMHVGDLPLTSNGEPSYGCGSPSDSPSATYAESGSEQARRYHGSFASLWSSSPVESNGRHVNSAANECETHRLAIERRKEFVTRIRDHIDLERHDQTRLLFVGSGGGVSLIHNCARMGFGEFVVIDPDVIADSNVATQAADPAHIGRCKAHATAEVITNLNPAAAVVSMSGRIESVDDAEFGRLLRSPMRRCIASGRPVAPRDTVLLALTDNFEAQARCHRLGLQFGIPTICAQEYVEGRGAEVTYTMPGVTEACHRCITASRYRAYLEQRFKNNVTSAGAPIFAAEFLNAVLGHILLGIVHHGTKDDRWGTLIEELGCRNLIRLRLDPNFDELFGDAFSRRQAGAAEPESLRMFDSLFLNQTPDRGQSATRPTCPDCNGTGDLRDAVGSFVDTRQMRRFA